MRTTQFEAALLLRLFHRRQSATMDEMKAALGTTVDRTVFRKLSEFPYLSSYSHRGKFYTLEALAQFDVTAAECGYQFHRFHRCPGTHPLTRERFFACGSMTRGRALERASAAWKRRQPC